MWKADPDADLEQSLADWRRYRKRKWFGDIDWTELLYKADLAFFAGLGVIIALGAVMGDERLTAGHHADVVAAGPDWLGVGVAAMVAIGLRSGNRGGPLVLEQAEVRHVLLAPVDRTSALRGPALRQLRFLVFAATLVGATVGHFAWRRMGDNPAAWIFGGAVLGASSVILAYGAALWAAAVRLRSWLGTLLGLALVAVAIADGVDLVEGAPTTAWGHIGMWAEGFSALSVVAIAASIAVLGVGLLRVGDVSIEAAERRSTLVGQLRFAATLQDLRTVIVLRRQLAMELPRLRPWVRLRVRGTGWLPVWTRGWRGVLRWPAARLGRLLLLAVIAGLALRGAWEGTTPLLAAAGLALFIAGLDATESLAQEIDHPSTVESAPIERGNLYLRHLPVSVAVMVLVAAVAAVAALVVDPSGSGLALAAVCVLPAALGAVAGATSSVIGGAPGAGGGAWAFLPPEAVGVRLLVRTALPPGLAIVGTLPLLAARSAMENGRPVLEAAEAAAMGVAILCAIVAGWVRTRDQLHAAAAAAMESASMTKARNDGR